MQNFKIFLSIQGKTRHKMTKRRKRASPLVARTAF
jgi:hypothetical protein